MTNLVSPFGGDRYDRTTILFHWLAAALVLGLWTVGQLADFVPKGPARGFVWSSHVVFGGLLAVIVAARIAWRLTGGRKLEGIGSPSVVMVAKLVHVALYGLLLAVIALGIASALVRGFNIYGIFALPQVGDPAMKHDITEWHELAANLLLALVAAHVAAALFHQLYWRDTVLARMRLR